MCVQTLKPLVVGSQKTLGPAPLAPSVKPSQTHANEKAISNAKKIKSTLEYFTISCKTGEGMQQIIDWFERGILAKKQCS